MFKLTKEQSKSLLNLYYRDLDTVQSNKDYEVENGNKLPPHMTKITWKSFLDCRRQIQKHNINNDPVMLQWRGMWIGIEKDGYRHS